jgi:hypothetical protein
LPPGAGIVPPDHKQELAMIVTNSNELNETRELNADELDLVSGGGLFSLALRIASFNTLATIYERSGGPDVNVGIPPAK